MSLILQLYIPVALVWAGGFLTGVGVTIGVISGRRRKPNGR